LCRERGDAWPKTVIVDPKDFYDFTLDFPQRVRGELGTVLVKQNDMLEALHAFDNAGVDYDTALVAERFVSLDDLTAYALARPKRANTDWFNLMVARRMLREGRADEALLWIDNIEWFRERHIPYREVKMFAEQKRIADDARLHAEERALAYYNMARVTAIHGRKMMGTESAPDFMIMDPEQSYRHSQLESVLKWLDDETLSENILSLPDTIFRHQRWLAMEYCTKAADFAESADLKIAALVLGGSIPRGGDPERSDVFFKRICNTLRPHPVAEAINTRNWFPGYMQEMMMKSAEKTEAQTMEDVAELMEKLIDKINELKKPADAAEDAAVDAVG